MQRCVPGRQILRTSAKRLSVAAVLILLLMLHTPLVSAEQPSVPREGGKEAAKDQAAGPKEGMDEGQPEVIAWLNIGYSSKVAADRMIGRNLKKKGWPGLIHEYFWSQLRWGARRLMIHNPFGAKPDDKDMPFDQAVEAEEEGLAWLTDGFVSAWTRVVEGDYTDGEPVEVIAYIGSITRDPEMVALLEADDLDGWNERAWASVAPMLKAGMNIAFDAGSLVEEDHPAYQFMLELQERGTRVYIETYPTKEKPHLYQFHIIMLERFNRAVVNHQHLYPMRDELKHRVLRILSEHSRDKDVPNWYSERAMEVLSSGEHVIVNINELSKVGLTKKRLMQQLTTQRNAADK